MFDAAVRKVTHLAQWHHNLVGRLAAEFEDLRADICVFLNFLSDEIALLG